MKIFVNVLMSFMLFWCIMGFTMVGNGKTTGDVNFFDSFCDFVSNIDFDYSIDAIDNWATENLEVHDYSEDDSTIVTILKSICDVLLFIPDCLVRIVSVVIGQAYNAIKIFVVIVKFFEMLGLSVGYSVM